MNGTNQAARVADNTALYIANNLTVCVWVKSDIANISGTTVLISKFQITGHEREWQLYFDADEKLNVGFGNPADGTSIGLWTSSNAVTVTSFNNYAFGFSSGDIAVYVNGAEIAGSVVSGLIPATLYNGTSELILGARLVLGSLNALLDGQIFDARIYAGDSTVLTAAQILSIYEDGVNNVEFVGQSLRASYVCAEGAGTGILDSSGNENHGTI